MLEGGGNTRSTESARGRTIRIARFLSASVRGMPAYNPDVSHETLLAKGPSNTGFSPRPLAFCPITRKLYFDDAQNKKTGETINV